MFFKNVTRKSRYWWFVQHFTTFVWGIDCLVYSQSIFVNNVGYLLIIFYQVHWIPVSVEHNLNVYVVHVFNSFIENKLDRGFGNLWENIISGLIKFKSFNEYKILIYFSVQNDWYLVSFIQKLFTHLSTMFSKFHVGKNSWIAHFIVDLDLWAVC